MVKGPQTISFWRQHLLLLRHLLFHALLSQFLKDGRFQGLLLLYLFLHVLRYLRLVARRRFLFRLLPTGEIGRVLPLRGQAIMPVEGRVLFNRLQLLLSNLVCGGEVHLKPLKVIVILLKHGRLLRDLWQLCLHQGVFFLEQRLQLLHVSVDLDLGRRVDARLLLLVTRRPFLG